MAVNAYLVIDGIDGPSTSRTKAIDCLSFSFGASNTATYGVGASGMESKAGRADFSNLNIMKVLDKTSSLLFGACIGATVLKSVVLYYDKTVGSATKPEQADYFKITLQDAIVTSQQLSGSSENPTESISFAFNAVEVSYAAQKTDGTLDSFVPKGFSLETLAAWTAPA
ncbi:MAG: Hcp family type VI secretion system effector [Terriglobia bacterium]